MTSLINISFVPRLAALLVFTCCMGSSCTKLVEVDPPVTSTNGENVYGTDANAIAALTGIYTAMSQQVSGGIGSLSLYPSLSADELALNAGAGGTSVNYYRNALTSGNGDYWKSFYSTIYVTNAAIEGLSQSTSVTPTVKQQLLGEAKFMRAFCFFYLVNLYGDVPLPLASDYTVNAVLGRSSKQDVYAQIVGDLQDAQTLLSENFLDGTLKKTSADRVRPTRWAASALLARVQLYQGAWSEAEATVSSLLNNTAGIDFTANLDDVFLSGSSEAIWQLQPVNLGENTPDAKLFILPDTGPDNFNFPVYLNTELVNSFETGDLRRTHWIDSVTVGSATYYYPFKYKVNELNAPVTEYKIVLRLTEQLLIRAEARAQQDNLSGALEDLNLIRQRAELLDYAGAMDKATILSAIADERQVELFTEWGDRWLNLKRTGTVDAVMNTVTALKGGTWDTNWQWYPVPAGDLESDPNIEQNAGY